MSPSSCLASSVLALALVVPVLADEIEEPNPLDYLKLVAKAKFEAMHRTPAERAAAMADAARANGHARFQEFQAGKITPDLLLASSRLRLEAELALQDKDANPAPLYEQYFRDAQEIEWVTETKLKAGKLGKADMAQVREDRLHAELLWLQHRGAADKPAPGELDSLAGSRPWPQAKASAIRADRQRLAEERREAAQEALHERLREFDSGKITPDLLIEASQQAFDAESALLEKDANPTPLREWRWMTLWKVENVAEAKLSAGKLAIADFYDCRSHRLEAEIAWLEHAKDAEKQAGPNRPASLETGDAADDKDWAKAKETAAGTDVAGLRQERLHAAHEMYRARYQEFQAGKVSPEMLLEPSLQLLDAECAVGGPQEEKAAVDRYWRVALEMYFIAQVKLQAGKIGVADVQQAHYLMLQAELWMTTGRPRR